jgi:hypothetical protein
LRPDLQADVGVQEEAAHTGMCHTGKHAQESLPPERLPESAEGDSQEAETAAQQ